LTGYLTPRARAVALSVAAVAVAVDALLLTVDLANGSPVADVGGPFLDGWGFGKAVLGAAGLLLVAWWAQSARWGVFAGVFTLIAIQDRLSWHGRVGSAMARALDLTGLTRLLPASPSAWGSFLVLLGVGAVGGAAVILAWRSHPPLRRPAVVLGGLLAALFFFAAIVNLLGSALPDLPFGWVEELGESLVLSLALSYVCGLVALGPAWLRSAPRTDRVLQPD